MNELTPNEKAALIGNLWDGTGECPDVSRPENYIKALEAARKPDRGILIGVSPANPTIFTVYERGSLKINTTSPVNALAALYDAEHAAKEPE